jgi:phosphoserine phosphatase
MPHPHVLVLTANPASLALDESVTATVQALTGTTGRWLRPGSAFEAPIEDPGVRETIAAALAGRPIDVNTVATANRAKRLLVADMESTMIEQEMIDELAGLAGRRDEIAAITLATMRGDLDFEDSLRHRVALLAGLTLADMETAARRITPMPGAAALVSAMKAGGATTALVTGGFTIFAERVATMLGFDQLSANILLVESGRLTGHVADPVLDQSAKRDRLLELAAAADLELSQTLAVGDGANDLAMLEAAGLGVAFRAKPAVRAAMRSSPTGAVIDHADLTALLHLQGLFAPPA